MSTQRDDSEALDDLDLIERVEALEKQFAKVQADAELARSAERGWKASLQARGDVVFRSDAGQVARMPVALARQLALKRAIDLVVRESEDGGAVQFLTGEDGEVVAEIPKALFVVLDRVLSETPWNKPLYESQSQSQSPGPPSETAPRKAPKPRRGRR